MALGTKTLYAKWEKDTEQTTVPLTIQKVFSGIQAGQIPSNFYLTYTITNERGSSDVISLDRSSATLTTYNGSPALTWVIQIPSGITNTLQFTEYNATLDNYSHRASAMEFIIDSNFSGGTKTITNTYTQTPVTTYTVVYTDGVEGEEIFPNQTFSNLSLGDPTPAFDGTPSRSGYTFLGWDPEPSETVLSSVTYVAQWEKLDEPTPRPGISYQIVPANRNDSALWSIPTTQTKINPSMGGLR